MSWITRLPLKKTSSRGLTLHSLRLRLRQMRVLDIFSTKSETPDPAPAAPEVSREQELLCELRDADRELSEHNEAMRAFRQKHFVFLDGRIAIRTSKPFEGEQISRQWLDLGRTRMQLIQKRDAILKRWSEAKGVLT
jgi:hypothetical protein